MESMAWRQRPTASRVRTAQSSEEHGGEPASMNEVHRLELYAKVNKPPEVKFKDLEAVVTSRIVRDQLHFNWRTDYLKVTNDTVLVQ